METIIIISLIVISAIFVISMIYKGLSGKKSCNCPMAKKCSGKCDEGDKPGKG